MGVFALAACTLVPLARIGLRLRPRLRFAEGDRSVIITIAAAEQGRADVGQVLAETGPATVVMAWLAAALLVATAVPVARVFVLGPGSGRTAALAWPIVAFAPAVVGFTLLGLASRTLLAQHLGKASGVANAGAWAAVIISVAVLRLVVPAAWLVPALAGSVSLGMVLGAVVGWLLVRRSGMPGVRLARPSLVGLAAAVPAAGVGAAASLLLAEVGIGLAVLGACAVAMLCVLVFAAMLRLLAPSLLAQMWALRRRTPSADVGTQ